MSTQVANTPRFLLVACCYQEGLKARLLKVVSILYNLAAFIAPVAPSFR